MVERTPYRSNLEVGGTLVPPRSAFDNPNETALLRESKGALEGNNLGAPRPEQPPRFEDQELTLTRVRLAEAAVADSIDALNLLAKLHSQGVVSRVELEQQGVTVSDLVAVGTLARAQLCDIDAGGVRITAQGMNFAEELSR